MNSSQTLIFLTFILLLLSITNCSKVNPSEQNIILEITVKNQQNEALPGRPVILSDIPVNTDNIEYLEALNEKVSDGSGKVKFSITRYVLEEEIEQFFFLSYEELFTSEINITGSGEYLVENKDFRNISLDLVLDNSGTSYAYGNQSGNINSELAKNEYERWRASEVTNCADGLRVISDPASETLVEAIGFGTILSAYAGDRETFDGLMKFYESKRTSTANQMMAWSVTCDNINDPGSATDGDIDVAFANIVAHSKWDGNYLDKAIEIINIIEENLIATCTVNGSETYILHPGFSTIAWGGCGMTDIQYYTPGFFRKFAEVTGKEIWNDLADDSYTLLNASAHPETGLVPDWQTAEGEPGPGGRAGHFGYDACRVPWRMTLDYIWNGNQHAEEWCKKVSDWAFEQGASNIVDGYELTGEPIGENGLNSAFLGGFTVAMMANTSEKLNAFSNVFAGLNDNYWFNFNTRVLYLFALSGNMQEPEI